MNTIGLNSLQSANHGKISLKGLVIAEKKLTRHPVNENLNEGLSSNNIHKS